MSFSTDLQAWSSHKALLSLHDFEVNLYEGIKRFMSCRIKSDLEYAKTLSSLTDNAQRVLPLEFSTPFSKMWSNVLQQISAMSELISSNCTQMIEACIPKLENLISEKKTSMKTFDSQRNKLNMELEKLEDEVKKNFINYERLLQKFNHLKDKMNLAKKGQSISKSEELWSKMTGVAFKIHSAHNSYLLSMWEFNLFQRHHNSVLLPGALDRQQELMESSLGCCQEILREFCNLTNYTGKNFQLVHENISKLVILVNPSLEYGDFVTTFRSDPLTFTKKEFDPSLSDAFLGIGEDNLVVDESTSDELKKIEMNMVEKLMLTKQNLAMRRKELEALKGEGSSESLTSDISSKSLKREIFELQCYEESYNSLLLRVSEALNSSSGFARTFETFDNLENDNMENLHSSDPDKELTGSNSSQFLTLFGRGKVAKKAMKTKLEKLFLSSGKKNEVHPMAGYEQSNSLRLFSRSKKNRSNSLKDDQDIDDFHCNSNDVVPYCPNGFGRRNRSSSETKLNRKGRTPQTSEDHWVPDIGWDSPPQKTTSGVLERTDDIRNRGIESKISLMRPHTDIRDKTLWENRLSSSVDDSSTSSSESLRLRLASKPPPPLPPTKDQSTKSLKLNKASLESQEWFHGLLPREEVLHLLQNEGDFLVRTTRNKAAPSSYGPHRQQQFVLSVSSKGGHKHFIIQESEEGFHFEEDSFPTIKELISHYLKMGLHVTERSQVVIKTPILRQAWELRNDDIELKEKIGSGQFGEVYKGVLTIKSPQKSHSSKSPSLSKVSDQRNSKNIPKPVVPPKPSALVSLPSTPMPSQVSSSLPPSNDEMIVAVKICKDSMDDDNRARFLKEAKILRLYRHRNIVGFMGVATLRAPVMIVMEFVEGGSLLNFVRRNNDLSQSCLLSMCCDIAAGMTYLESMKCIHRDLAARNCLVSPSKEDTEAGVEQQYIIKISDFGMSKTEDEYVITAGTRQIPIKWTSPEALNYGKYTTASDVWSFGVVVWEIFSNGRIPYQGMSNAVASELVEKGHRLPQTESMPSKLYELLLKCWYKAPEERPRFCQIVNDLKEIKQCIK